MKIEAVNTEFCVIQEQEITEFNGYYSVPVKVVGYWSSDSINVRVTSNWYDENIKVSISHSSGGRSTEEEPSDVKAERNFAKALLAACDIAAYFEENINVLAAMHAEYTQKLMKMAEEKAKLKRSKVETDSSLSKSKVEQVMLRAATSIRVRGSENVVRVVNVGNSSYRKFTVDGNPATHQQLREFLSTMAAEIVE